MAQITIQIRFFAGQRAIVGVGSRQQTLPSGSSVADLWQQLCTEYPRLAPYAGRMLIARNQEFCDMTAQLADGDEIAFIPPVSGGTGTTAAPLFHLTEEPLAATPLVTAVQTPSDGAVVTFTGVVRNEFGGRPTAYLIYEAYHEMALAGLQRLADEARAAHAVGRIAVHHRLGRLAIGETAVLVVVAAPHRQAAFAAAAYIMDRIKEVVPIWKEEHWADGDAEWRE